jgi:hypothetical protein
MGTIILFQDLVSARLYPKVNKGWQASCAHKLAFFGQEEEQVMNELPATVGRVLESFAVLFRPHIWVRARALLVGAILCPGTRTVTAALRVLGRSEERDFQNYHRILNRVRWSPRTASRILLNKLVAAFVPEGEPLILGVDEHLERRRGKRYQPKGCIEIRSAPAGVYS